MTIQEFYKMSLEELKQLHHEEMTTLVDKELTWQQLEYLEKLIEMKAVKDIVKEMIEVTQPSELAQELYFYFDNNKHESKIDTIVGIAKKLINWEKEIRLDQIDKDDKAFKKEIKKWTLKL
tara:strand:- start:1034 stop:1396 length:363 start_codon:yes stop_codon:yes gene_type:complete